MKQPLPQHKSKHLFLKENFEKLNLILAASKKLENHIDEARNLLTTSRSFYK